MDMTTRDMTPQPLDEAELISALVDGQLQGEAFARTVDRLVHSDAARASWHTYHVVGEVLRSGEAQGCGRDAAFMQRLRLGLQQSSVQVLMDDDVLVSPAQPDPTSTAPTSTASTPKYTSANDAFFSWKHLALAASLAAFMLTGWTLLGSFERAQVAAQLAQAEASAGPAPQALTAQTAEPPVMLRDPRLDALLAAHKQFGGTSALQTPAGFLRNATFEGAAR